MPNDDSHHAEMKPSTKVAGTSELEQSSGSCRVWVASASITYVESIDAGKVSSTFHMKLEKDNQNPE